MYTIDPNKLRSTTLSSAQVLAFRAHVETYQADWPFTGLLLRNLVAVVILSPYIGESNGQEDGK